MTVTATGPSSEVVAEARVLLGVPGLDLVFSNGVIPTGIRPGSLVLVAGPPGSGKTRLALQLLMEMRLEPATAGSRRTLFLSCDEKVNVLRQNAPQVLPPVNGSVPTLTPASVPDIVQMPSFLWEAEFEIKAVGEAGRCGGSHRFRHHSQRHRLAVPAARLGRGTGQGTQARRAEGIEVDRRKVPRPDVRLSGSLDFIFGRLEPNPCA